MLLFPCLWLMACFCVLRPRLSPSCRRSWCPWWMPYSPSWCPRLTSVTRKQPMIVNCCGAATFCFCPPSCPMTASTSSRLWVGQLCVRLCVHAVHVHKTSLHCCCCCYDVVIKQIATAVEWWRGERLWKWWRCQWWWWGWGTVVWCWGRWCCRDGQCQPGADVGGPGGCGGAGPPQSTLLLLHPQETDRGLGWDWFLALLNATSLCLWASGISRAQELGERGGLGFPP